MKNKIIHIPFIIILTFLFNTCFGQNTGYAGKRFLIKTDAVNGVKSVFSGIGIEASVFRYTTFTVGYKLYSSMITQKYDPGEYPYSDTYNCPTALPDKANTLTNSLLLEIRQYANQGIIAPAPNGFFGYLSGEFGKVDIEGNYYESLLIKNIQDSKGQYFEYEFENVSFNSVELGLGYQGFINKWLTLGFKFGIDYTTIKSPDNSDQEKILSGVARKYGFNLFGGRPSLNPGLSDTGAMDPARSSIGLSFYGQIGVMLF